MLKLAQDGVVVLDQPEADESGEIVQLIRGQMPAPTRRPDDLVDKIEVVKKEPLLSHARGGPGSDYRKAHAPTQGHERTFCTQREN